jgi:cytochrome c-type biogenesis protein CcmH/NrfG
MERKRFPRQDSSGLKMLQLSEEAYQRAVSLLPNDADWHYGYADLLYSEAQWFD